MANVQFRFNPKANLTEINVSGHMSMTETIHYTNTFYNKYSYPNVLWNVRNAFFTSNNEESINWLIISLKELILMPVGSKTAIICRDNEGEKNMANLYASSIFEGESTISYKVFTDKNSALNWIAPSYH